MKVTRSAVVCPHRQGRRAGTQVRHREQTISSHCCDRHDAGRHERGQCRGPAILDDRSGRGRGAESSLAAGALPDTEPDRRRARWRERRSLPCDEDSRRSCRIGRTRGHPGGTARRRAERPIRPVRPRSEEHTSELQSHHDLVCRLLLEKKKKKKKRKNTKKKKKNTTQIKKTQ